MSGRVVKIGTRGSALALAQAHSTAEVLTRAGVRARLVVVETAGDRRGPDLAWGEGAFVAAIEHELLAGRVDVAVHSAKDVPTDADPRLWIAAYLERADPRDALVVAPGLGAIPGFGGSLDDLPSGARIGTDSPRRTGFLLAHRPDLDVRPIHGNVDTRLRRLDAGDADALVLACAGLDRLGLGGRIAERLDPEVVPPAPGQGALAIQVRADDAEMVEIVGRLDHHATRLAVETERAFLAASGGGCRSPIGALATVGSDGLDLLGAHVMVDGSSARAGHLHGPLDGGPSLAANLATALLGAPSGRSIRSPLAPQPPSRVLVTRTLEQADGLMAALRSVGLDPCAVPTIDVELAPGGGDLDGALRRLGAYAWVVVTSGNGARALLRGAERVFTPFEASRVAVIGDATRGVLEQQDVDVQFQPTRSSSAAMAVELPVSAGDRILLIRGNLADAALPSALRARGAIVDDVIGYRTVEAPEASGHLLRRVLDEGPLAAIVFTSGSTISGLLELGRREGIGILGVPAVCIGPETAAEAERAGFRVAGIAPATDAWTLALTTVRAVRDALGGADTGLVSLPAADTGVASLPAVSRR